MSATSASPGGGERRRGAVAVWMGLMLMLACASLLGGCPNKNPKDSSCDSDKDCKDGKRCINKQCAECSSDSDCPANHSCQQGVCMETGPECTKDTDCKNGQVCKNQSCVPCEQDGDCGPGGTCNGGVCLRAKPCKVNEECEDDQDCIDGLCLNPGRGGAPDGLTCELATVYFEFDQASISESARNSLDKNAACIRQAPEQRGVYVVGHADESGTEEYNIALSERRARSVVEFLVRLGIAAARLQVLPKGESEPSGQGPEADRRVQFEWK